MRKTCLVLLGLLGLASCSDTRPVATKETSPAGIAYTLIQMPGQEKVALRAAWATDWVYHDTHNWSTPLVGAQLILAGGAEGYPAGKAVELFADLKAEANLAAGPDSVVGSLIVLKANLSKAIAITHAHLVSPALDENWLQRIRKQIADETTKENTNTVSQVNATLRHALFGNQPMGQFIGPDVSSLISTVTVDNIRQWKQEVFSRSTPLIVIAGDISASQAGEAIDTLLKDLPAEKHDLDRSLNVNFKPRTILLHMPEAKDPQLTLIGPFPLKVTDSEVSDYIANGLFGGGEQSLLFKTIRTELRASYSFSSQIDAYTDRDRILVISGGVDKDKLQQARDLVLKTYSDFKKAGPSEGIDGFKTRMSTYFSSTFIKSPEIMSQTMLFSLLTGQNIDYVLQFADAVNAASKESIQVRLDKGFPDASQFIVVAASPDANSLPGACVIEKPADAANCP